ncbi:SEFIR domain protein [Haliangium ochraceum DSM 14365]|uniref:SEFIR domain protein n=2 Tax=Haliangium ochraceum TaxID=80816 RepID=D0LQS1_HALO1|nr:SEFIR domain protein [Haliangium ochraceum DSM 14365]
MIPTMPQSEPEKASASAPRVFLSYSHDSPEHRDRVLDLAQRLRREGIDAWLDRFTPHPPEGWPRWMQRQLEQADHVLVVCTETFCLRFNGHEEPDRGLGATWEGFLATQVLYESGTRNDKLIPVLMEGARQSDIPLALRAYTHYRVPGGYDQLYRQITQQPEVVPANLGEVREMPQQQTRAADAIHARGTEPGAVPEMSPLSEGVAETPGGPISPFLPGVIAKRAEDFFGRQRALDEITHSIHHRQPIQILGEARMGKSSLLAHVARTLVPGDMQVAEVHARGRSGWSPRELILAMADALGQRAVVDSVLRAAPATVDEAPAAVNALQFLLPCALLLDDADAIADAGHHFDRAFLDECRALTQSRRLLWISASRRDLQSCFRETGLSSELLNNSRRVVIGQLDKKETEQLLGVLGASMDERCYRQAGGWPDGLQWLGDRLWRDGERASTDDDFANAMEQTFRSWWKLRTQAEHALLRRLVLPTPITGLSDSERRRARKLVSRGLLCERDGAFALLGAAWANWVRDVE